MAPRLSPRAIEAVLAATDLEADLPLASVEIRTLGPAAQQEPSLPDAVGGRPGPHLLNVYAAPDPSFTDDARLAVARTVLDVMVPWRAPVNLINFVGRANGLDAILHSWTQEQSDRLDAIRGRHDPDGLFPFTRHGASVPLDADPEAHER